MALRRIKLSLHRGHALELTRVSVGKAKLVYVLIADKKINMISASHVSHISEPPRKGMLALHRVLPPVRKTSLIFEGYMPFTHE